MTETYREEKYWTDENGKCVEKSKLFNLGVDPYDDEDQRFLNVLNSKRTKLGIGGTLDFEDCYRHWQLNKLATKDAWRIMNEHLVDIEAQAEYLRKKAAEYDISYDEHIKNCNKWAEIIRKYISEIGEAMREGQKAEKGNPIVLLPIVREILDNCPHVEKQDNGKPRITGSMDDFIQWLIGNNYMSENRKESKTMAVSPQFIFNNFDSGCNIESIRKAYRNLSKNTQKTDKSGINPA